MQTVLSPKSSSRPLLSWLEKAEGLFDRLAPLAAVVVLAVFSLWAWLFSRSLHLWYDELLGIAVALAPTPADMRAYLKAAIDMNPPLYHYPLRASVAMFGTADWAPRLPSYMGMIVMLICLYRALAKWISPSYGVLGMLLVICMPIRIYATEARPYGLLLGFVSIAILCYLQAVRGRRIPGLVGLALCTAAMAGSHYYGSLAAGAFAIAELGRSWLNRKLDWTTFACILVPPVAVLASIRDITQSQREVLSNYFALGNLLSFKDGYERMEVDPVVYGLFVTLMAVAAGWMVLKRRENERPEARQESLNKEELLVGLSLLLLPLIGVLFTQFVTHAYVSRYFVSASIGFAICACYFTRIFSRQIPGLVLMLSLALTVGFGKLLMHEVFHPNRDPLPGTSLLSTNLPLVFDSPSEFLQISYYQPSLRSRMWMIAEPATSLHYRAYDTDDRVMLALGEKGLAQTITLGETIRRWPQFHLIPRENDRKWVLQCLADAGAPLQLRSFVGPINFAFDVTVPPESVAQIDACSIPEKGAVSSRK